MSYLKIQTNHGDIEVNKKNITTARPSAITGGYGLFITVLPGKEFQVITGEEPFATQAAVILKAKELLEDE